MLSISFWHVSGGISVHSFATLSHNSCTPLGGMSYCWSLALRCCQRCSMGFISGDWAGHFMGMMLLSENHWSAFFEVCFGLLSCWKYHLSLAISKLSKKCSPPLPPPKSHNTALHPCSPAPLSASPPHSSPYTPKLSSSSPLHLCQLV